jgi:hypothetical protein
MTDRQFVKFVTFSQPNDIVSVTLVRIGAQPGDVDIMERAPAHPPRPRAPWPDESGLIDKTDEVQR